METITKKSIRDHFRSARANAFSESEGFKYVLFAIERFGTILINRVGTLAKYAKPMNEFAKNSPIAYSLSQKYPFLFTQFDKLYEIVRVARNDALHQGAYARNITSHTIELCIILEDALSIKFTSVSDFMVKGVVQAELWQPLAFIRQQMLMHSFSHLPIRMSTNVWQLVSDHSLAITLRSNKISREDLLGMTLDDAIKFQLIKLSDAIVIKPDEEIQNVLSLFSDQPLLVCHPNNRYEIIGIISAFDLM